MALSFMHLSASAKDSRGMITVTPQLSIWEVVSNVGSRAPMIEPFLCCRTCLGQREEQVGCGQRCKLSHEADEEVESSESQQFVKKINARPSLSRHF